MEIKTCPFCGGRACLNSNYSYKTRSYFVFVKCNVCNAQSKPYYSPDEPEKVGWKNDSCNDAIEAWNLRADEKSYTVYD